MKLEKEKQIKCIENKYIEAIKNNDAQSKYDFLVILNNLKNKGKQIIAPHIPMQP